MAVATLVTLAALTASGRAYADPSAADKETARRLMAEGRAHRKDGDLKAALQSFVAADAIMHVPTTGLEVARTEVDLGQLVEARDQLLTVARLPDAEKEPRAFTEARETAKTLGAEIEPRIPSIVIKVQGAAPDAAVKVTVDDAPVPPAALVAPRPVDPGHHVVAARVGDGEPKQVEVDVGEGEAKAVSIDLSAAEVAASAVKPRQSDQTDPLRLASYVSFGVGGVGIIVGAVTGVLAITKLSSAKQQGCVANQCPPAADSQLDTAGTMATVSTVAFIVGGIGVAGGVVGFLLSRRPPASTSSAHRAPEHPLSVGFSFGPGYAGVQGTF